MILAISIFVFGGLKEAHNYKYYNYRKINYKSLNSLIFIFYFILNSLFVNKIIVLFMKT